MYELAKLTLILLFFFPWNCFSLELPAFVGAKGFGTKTPAGRGGKILKVYNLNDSGPGSFREAVEKKGPRIIIFEVSGELKLLSDVVIKEPFCTIAGQTAPNPGIHLVGRTISIQTHDILIQHITVRVGDKNKSKEHNWDTSDSIQIYGVNAYNIVIDHVSISWSIDENIGIGSGAKNITVSNSIISEPLNNSLHSKGKHGFNILIGFNTSRISIINNLIVHGEARNPYCQGTEALVANNIIYNNGKMVKEFISVGSDVNKMYPCNLSIIGNYFKSGFDSENKYAIGVWKKYLRRDSRIFYEGNTFDGEIINEFISDIAPPLNSWPYGFEKRYLVNPLMVLKKVGSRPRFRSLIDSRIVYDFINGKGKIIDSQEEVGGFPEIIKNRISYDEMDLQKSNNGIRKIEELLEAKRIEVEGIHYGQ